MAEASAAQRVDSRRVSLATEEFRLREKEAEMEGHDGLSFSEGHWEWEE